MPRSPARRRPVVRIRAHGFWRAQGPQVTDQVNGWPVPTKFCVKQRGGLVSRYLKDGSYDRPDWW